MNSSFMNGIHYGIKRGDIDYKFRCHTNVNHNEMQYWYNTLWYDISYNIAVAGAEHKFQQWGVFLWEFWKQNDWDMSWYNCTTM